MLLPGLSGSARALSRGVCRIFALTFVSAFVAAGGAVAAPCTGPGAPPAGSPFVCTTAVAIPGNPVTSFDISFFNPTRSEYYLADRSNTGIDIISTAGGTPTFVKTIGGFVGCVVNSTTNTCIASKSGPAGVAAHGIWLYAGDGNSTLKVIDLTTGKITGDLSTGGTTRVDEMALTTDGTLLLTANNAEDPPYATLFKACGDATSGNCNTTVFSKITVDTSLIPAGLGLSIEQPAWDPSTKRFYVSVPQINYPAGCTPTSTEENPEGTVPCQGGLLVIDPNGVAAGSTNYGPFNSSVNAGLMAIGDCGPNGAAVGPPNDSLTNNLLLGCTPANMPSNIGTFVINSTTKNFATIGNITGSDEVWYNPGDNRYFTGSSANRADLGGPVLGVIDATTNLLIGTVPQGSGSHSVAVDNIHNLIFVPQVVPKNVNGPPGAGSGDSTGVSAGICGTSNGCVAVYLDASPAVD